MRPGGLILVAVTILAGCVAIATPLALNDEPSGFATASEPLWPDPQNAPHPMWNWPTLAYPAVGADVPAYWDPIPAAPLPETVAGLEHVARASPNVRGAGIAVFGSLVVAPAYNADSHLVDVSDPTAPEVIETIPGRHRGAAVIAYPTGRLVAVFATSSQLEFFDITDPTNAFFLSEVNPRGGSHKVGVVPGTPIVYNANTDGEGSVISIYDLTNPETPVLVKDFAGGYGCHHVYFWISVEQDKYRAICAGVEATQILDIRDPRDPQVIVDVPVHHGVPGTPSTGVSPARFSHFAILSEDGKTLIVGDETGGGAAPGCDAHAQAAGLVSASGPLGNVYFYDLTDETFPILQGWFNPGSHYLAQTSIPGACTAHHGRLVPDPAGERDLLVMAYYSAGTVLIDFTDPKFPQLVDQFAEGTTWEAWHANGWILTGDLSRGVDVLRLR